LLAKLGLEHIGDELPQLMERASREDLGLLVFFNLVLNREWEQKEERRIKGHLSSCPEYPTDISSRNSTSFFREDWIKMFRSTQYL
jgi:hypothetical protein